MSYEAVATAVDCIRLYNLKNADKLTWLAICDHANTATRQCWPGIETIAARMCLSARSVQRAIRRLAGIGLISIKEGGGRLGANIYTIHLPTKGATALPAANVTTPGDSVSPPPVTRCHPNLEDLTKNNKQENINHTHPPDETTARVVDDEYECDIIEFDPDEIFFDSLDDQDISNRVPDAIPERPAPRPSVWQQGLGTLINLSGIYGATPLSERSARAIIGKWLKSLRNDNDALIDILNAASLEQPGSVVPWVTAAIQARVDPKPNTSIVSNHMSRLRGTEKEGAAIHASPEVKAAFDLWNEAAEENEWPLASKLNDDRATRLEKVLNEIEGIDEFKIALARLPNSPMNYHGDQDWVPSLDWLLKDSRAIRLCEEADHVALIAERDSLGAAEWAATNAARHSPVATAAGPTL